MWVRQLLLGISGFTFGIMVAAGVFTVLFVVGLIPRFASKTRTAKHEILYEEFIIWGSVFGCVASVFDGSYIVGEMLATLPSTAYDVVTNLVLSVIGIFAGIFVGCLSLAIAELLDSVPIFARRMKLHAGFGNIVMGIALGKVVGAIIYFLWEFSS